ncbi:MAG: tRNA lysidine(34) synthetase TilS [Bacteroidales bacterium]
MLDKLQKFITKHSLLQADQKILVAVSGGIDSMSLLHLLHQAAHTIIVAHCNFSLRAEASDSDETFVQNFCKQQNIPYFTKRFNTLQYAQSQGLSIQVAARNLRYEWFEQLAQEQHCDKIAIAHTLSDSIETFFINLTRGTGVRGLRGITVQHGKIIRPLLFATRSELEQYATQEQITYREDSSNNDTKYKRNFIRHKIVPHFKEANPAFEHTMQANMQRIAISQHLLQTQLEALQNNACVYEQDTVHIYIHKLPQVQQSFWLYELLHKYGFTETAVQNIEASLTSHSGKHFLSATHKLLKDRNKLIIKPINTDTQKTELQIIKKNISANTPTNLQYGKHNLHLQIISPIEVDFSSPHNIAFLDYDKLTFPLSLRQWKNGDKFMPYGMQGNKKVSDFLTDKKISLFDKQAHYVLLTASNTIVWLIAQRIDGAFAIDTNTKKVLRLEWKKNTVHL